MRGANCWVSVRTVIDTALQADVGRAAVLRVEPGSEVQRAFRINPVLGDVVGEHAFVPQCEA